MVLGIVMQLIRWDLFIISLKRAPSYIGTFFLRHGKVRYSLLARYAHEKSYEEEAWSYPVSTTSDAISNNFDMIQQ